ncbi:hypothetical protein AB5I41_28795 [Sphingomonas sp. MMS24-JH45]
MALRAPLRREADAIAAYEVENGPIGDGNVIMRVIISKPRERPA